MLNEQIHHKTPIPSVTFNYMVTGQHGARQHVALMRSRRQSIVTVYAVATLSQTSQKVVTVQCSD